MRLFGFLAALGVAFALAFLAITPPVALPADAPATDFSAVRAMSDVRAIGQVPHPTGSRENAHVRDHLIRRLEALDLEVSTQRADAFEQHEPGFATGGSIENLIGVWPGRDRAAPAVLLMSHYDSAIGSPGAADDAAGVSASLELVRALQAEGVQPERDLIVLITDGEEAGLLGARAFFAEHPLRERIGVVVNLETRGAAGRAFMFETGRGNGAMMALYGRAVGQPSTTSLAAYLYSVLPNDTDMSLPRDLGIPGFNLAFIGEPFEYHSPTSTPATLDQGSLQDLGAQALDLTRALVTVDALPPQQPNAVFADVFGLFTVVHAAWLGWLPVLLSGLVLAGLVWRSTDRKTTLRGAGFGFLGALGVTVLAAGLCQLVLILTGASTDFIQGRPLLGRFGAYELALFFAALGATLLIARLALRGREDGPRGHEPAAIGFIGFGWLLATVLQIIAPEAALIAAWPTLIGALALLATRRLGRPGWAVAAVLGGLGAAWMLALVHGVFIGVGATTPTGPGALTALALLPLAALLSRAARSRLIAPVGVLALLVALSLGLYLRLAPAGTPDHPQPTLVYFVADADDGTARLATPLRTLDWWTRSVLRGDGREIEEADIPALTGRPVTSAAVAPIAVSPPAFTLETLADGALRLTIQPTAATREFRLTFTGAPLEALSVAGHPLEPDQSGEATQLRWADPMRGLEVIVRPGADTEMHWAAFHDGWPAEAEPLPTRSPTLMPWGASDSLIVVGEIPLR